MSERRMFITAAIIALAVMTVMVTSVSAEDIYICNCSNLDTDGATYYLTQDITDSNISRCMDISANNVTLDCQHHAIDGDDSAQYGIYTTIATNITIKNGVLSDWSTTNLYLYKAHGNTIENITSSSSSSAMYGIHLHYSNHNTIINSTATDNRFGFYLLYSDNNTITDSTANSNDDGIYLYSSDFNIIKNSIIEDNSRWGICFGGKTNKIYNNLFNNSVNYNIYRYVQTWNTTRQVGDRVYSEGTEIGGNYWTNASGSGYSDTCTDADNDGFCDDPYILYIDYTGNNTDYLPLSDEFVAPPDLIVTSINAYHYNTLYPSWFNLSNDVEVIIENSGGTDAETFNVSLYAKDLFIDKRTVTELDAGNSTSVYFEWTPVGCDCEDDCSPDTYTLKAIADCDDVIAESNETNNESTVGETAYWDGWSADEELVLAANGTIRGGMLYTTGDGYYVSGLLSTDVHYDITLPEDASVELARLYVYYTWCKDDYAEVKVSIGGTEVPSDAEYNDRPCDSPAIGYNYPYGTYVYDLTPYVGGTGSYTVTVERVGGSWFCIAAPGLLILYKDDTEPEREYFILEGADILEGGRRGGAGCLSLEECMNNATFTGEIGDVDKVNTATLGIICPWGGAGGSSHYWFNDNYLGSESILGGYSTPYQRTVDGMTMSVGIGGSAQVGANVSDVTAYITSDNNTATFGDDGDSMVAANAFLLVEHIAEQPQTPLLIYGWVNCTNGGSVNDPSVTVTNLNTSEILITELDASSNYYQVVTGSYNVSAGDVLHFNMTRDNTTEFNHTVTATEIDAGGFTQNATIECSGPAGTCGDVNDDGSVDMTDVMTLWYDIVDYPTPGAYTISNAWAADVNCDGELDMTDVMTLWYDIADYPYVGAYEVNCCE